MKIKLGYLLIIIGVIIFSYQELSTKNKIIEEQNTINNTIQNKTGYLKKDLYTIILEIPQINLKKGIYDKLDSRNNIDSNITIHANSGYPDTENSNVILMAHSGSGEKAYFKDLYKLNQDSLIKIYYKDKKYVYKIIKIYDVEKNGNIRLPKTNLNKVITLITCNQKDKSKQTIYIGNLIDEL